VFQFYFCIPTWNTGHMDHPPPDGLHFGALNPPDPVGMPWALMHPADISFSTSAQSHTGHLGAGSLAENVSVSKQ
jgi:hypothetical protein